MDPVSSSSLLASPPPQRSPSPSNMSRKRSTINDEQPNGWQDIAQDVGSSRSDVRKDSINKDLAYPGNLNGGNPHRSRPASRAHSPAPITRQDSASGVPSPREMSDAKVINSAPPSQIPDRSASFSNYPIDHPATFPLPLSPSSAPNGLPPINPQDVGLTATKSNSASAANSFSAPHSGSTTNPSTSGSGSTAICTKCGQPMTGQFVRALGSVYHLDCFRCQDCGKVVAAKFFPVDGAEGKQYPLCETDYFRRLGLICATCGGALRGSYITALEMKFHVEHFTCSVCPTVFGPQDSYYEHSGAVYCHFHYSTRFAVKCTGCKTAILKQFVEINRNRVDEHWHPECYMIHKFWNIKLASSSSSKKALPPPETNDKVTSDDGGGLGGTGNDGSIKRGVAPEGQVIAPEEYLAQEAKETPTTLRDKQRQMEEQVYRIWTVLSTFEESSAACISEMLRRVSNGRYLDGVRMAEKFVLHVETLFSTMDDLGAQFRLAGAKEVSHVREARMLCKKIVNFFSLLSHTQETGARKMAITQELLSLVTGLAHYLKILIRIALTAALKLERDHGNRVAMGHFLGRLDRLVRDPEVSTPGGSDNVISRSPADQKSRPYGYKSLTRAVGTLVGQGEATTDLCESCKLTVEEECARFGTSLRWHLSCLKCSVCGRQASKERDPPPSKVEGQPNPIYLKEFRLEMAPPSEKDLNRPPNKGPPRPKAGRTFCPSCSFQGLSVGFDNVTRLEQYAFLLCVALNKLYALLKQRGVVPESTNLSVDPAPDSRTEERSLYDSYRDSSDIKRMKSVNLDRKVSTTARIPRRSVVVESPTGRSAQQGEPSVPPVPSLSKSADSRHQRPPPGAGDPRLAENRNRPMPASYGSGRELPRNVNDPSRPTLSRNTTAVRVVDDQPEQVAREKERLVLGSESEPTQHEDGLTLGDLTRVMQAEQARVAKRQTRRQGHFLLLSELPALEYFIVKHIAALALSNEPALKQETDLDELLEIIEARKNTFWGKLFKGANEKKPPVKKKGVFGIPLDILVEKNGTDSMHGAGPAPVRVPSFVDECVSAMKQMDMSVEGIFRKNGNIRRLKELTESLDRDVGSVNLADDNAVQLAALLKKFLRELPDPLLTFKLHKLFVACQHIDDDDRRRKVLHLLCCLMPKPHRDTMEVLFVFLKWVASFSHVDEETGSKMDLQNLATVICPNILYSRNNDPMKDENFLAIRCVHELLDYQDEFWMVPEEFEAILRDTELQANMQEMGSKDILRRCEYHLQRSKVQQPLRQRGEVMAPQRPDVHAGNSNLVSPSLAAMDR